jgi:hypothetical protein
MAQFSDTPVWKKARRWDPVEQKFVPLSVPPTQKQLRLIDSLAAERRTRRSRPVSRRDAQLMIRDLLAMPRVDR